MKQDNYTFNVKGLLVISRNNLQLKVSSIFVPCFSPWIITMQADNMLIRNAMKKQKEKGNFLYDSKPTMYRYINAVGYLTVLYPKMYIIQYLQQDLMNWYLFTLGGCALSLYSSTSPEKPHLHHFLL